MGNRPINRRPWRRAPWRKRLKPGEKGWINGTSTNCGFVPISGSNTCDPSDSEAYAGRTTIEIISGAELADHEGNLKMLRLVGDCIVAPNENAPAVMVTMSSTGTLLRAGLIVVEADMSSGSEQIPHVSPTDMVEEADRSWLWLRTEWIPPLFYTDGPGGGEYRYPDPTQTHKRFEIDVRVQRRLKADQRLCMMLTTVNTGILSEDLPDAEPIHMALNLRAFIAF